MGKPRQVGNAGVAEYGALAEAVHGGAQMHTLHGLQQPLQSMRGQYQYRRKGLGGRLGRCSLQRSLPCCKSFCAAPQRRPSERLQQ